MFNGNFRILKWRYLPYIRPIWYSTAILGSWNSHWHVDGKIGHRNPETLPLVPTNPKRFATTCRSIRCQRWRSDCFMMTMSLGWIWCQRMGSKYVEMPCFQDRSDRYLVCHRYVIASDGPISDFTQYFIGSITNHSCDFDMLYFSMASCSGWCFGTFGWFFPSYWDFFYHPNWLSLHHFPEG